MHLLLLLLLLFLLFPILEAEIVTESLSLVNQSVTPITNLRNKLIAQKFTDILPQLPLLQEADDFVLPVNFSSNLTIFYLSFSVVRVRTTSDPVSLTLQLLYTNESTQGPGEVFFTKVVSAPGNPPLWDNTTLGQVSVIQLNLTKGDMSSDNSGAIFDLANTTLLPRETRLWVSFYATGARDFTLTPYAENNLFWLTSGDNLTTDENNSVYYFVDASNVLKQRLSTWSNASVVEERLKLNSTSLQMAWQLTLLAVAPSNFWETLQKMATKEMAIVIVCSVVGFCLFLACLCVCVRRCRRIAAARRNKSQQVTVVPSEGPNYSVVDQEGDGSVAVWQTGTNNDYTLEPRRNPSHIPLDPTGGNGGGTRGNPLHGNLPESQYTESLNTLNHSKPSVASNYLKSVNNPTMKTVSASKGSKAI